MGAILEPTITAFNEYLQGLSNGEGSNLIDFSLVTFDTQGMDKVCVAVPIAQAPKLDRQNYVPRAGTPLIDAAVITLKAIEASLEKRGNPKVVMVIQTDGQENSSVKHTCEELKRLVDEKTAAGWQFLFLGAGIDAYDQAAKMGIAAMDTLSHSVDLQSTRAAYRAMAENSRAYASGMNEKASFSAKQKADAGDIYDAKRQPPKDDPYAHRQRQARFHLDDDNAKAPPSKEFTL
jgi:hypothetical protein